MDKPFVCIVDQKLYANFTLNWAPKAFKIQNLNYFHEKSQKNT